MIRRFSLALVCIFGALSAHADLIPAEDFDIPDDLEISVWASSPAFYNPSNMDVDRYGRIWVAEAVNYRRFNNKGFDVEFPEGDRVVWLQDTDGDGKADKSQVFVQDKDLVAPLGISVIDKRLLVAAAPHLVQYTDVDRNGIFDPEIDHKELWLTGFGGQDHDHSLHSITVGPDGWFYFNAGNAGPHIVTDKSGWTLRAGSSYNGGAPSMGSNRPGLVSDDGTIYRITPKGFKPMNPDFDLIALAFIGDRAAAEAMAKVANEGPQDLRDYANWWGHHRDDNDWKKFGIASLFPRLAPIVQKKSGNGKPRKNNVKVSGKKIFCSEVARGKKVVDIEADITGVARLFLVTRDADDGINSDWGNWIEPRLIDAQGKETKLTDIKSRTLQKVSIMPPASALGLNAQQLADLLEFLAASK